MRMFEYTDLLCVICREQFPAETLKDTDPHHCIQLTAKGIDTLRIFSEMRNDFELRDHLVQNPNAVNVHFDCRKNYTNKRRFERSCSTSSAADHTSPKKQLHGSQNNFDWRVHCFFCGDICPPSGKREDPVSVRTLEMKETLLLESQNRTDSWTLEVRGRLNMCNDLVAAEAIYHKYCRSKFYNLICHTAGVGRGRPEDPKINRNIMSEEMLMASTSLLDVSSDGDCHMLSGTPSMVAGGESSVRRISTRSIKRKKFDDELVESSLKSDRVRIKTQVSTEGKPSLPVASTSTIEQAESPIRAPPPVPEKKKIHKSSKSSSKRSKKSKASCIASNKDLGRWKPQDDLALILAVQQTCDLNAVYLGVKFSCKFSQNEIQERWYNLLYDPSLSKLALQAVKQLHPDIAASVHAKTLFSKEEESLLSTVSSTSQPTVDTFEELLEKNRLVFIGRTSKALFNHWLLMKQYHLLPDQTVQPMPKGDHVLNFSDAEDLLNDQDLQEQSNEDLEHELTVADRRQKKEIRNLEQELPKWQVTVDSVTGISPPEFDQLTLAVIRGRLVRYLCDLKRQITLGRATKDNQIDVDLSLEGPAWKISRRQGIIKLKSNGDFYIANEGKRPIYVDGKAVLMGNKEQLNNNSVVEITCLRFIFLINQDLINNIKQETLKTATSSNV